MAKNPHAVALGKLGGHKTSDAKAKAARENGKKGGRPKGPLGMTPEQRSAKREVMRLARQWGCDLDTSDGEVKIAAPSGCIWTSDAVHELVHSPWDSETQADLWVEALRRMRVGFEPCGCDEWCGGGR